MTEAMPFLQKYDITFLRPPTIAGGVFFAITAAFDVVSYMFWRENMFNRTKIGKIRNKCK